MFHNTTCFYLTPTNKGEVVSLLQGLQERFLSANILL